MSDPSPLRTKTVRVLLLLSLAASLIAGSALARDQAVRCSSIVIRKQHDPEELDVLRDVVQGHIARLNETKWPHGPYVIKVALVDLSMNQGRYGLEATAILQAVVHHRESGNLLGGFRGRATAASQGSQRRLAARSALRLAANSVFARFTEVTDRR